MSTVTILIPVHTLPTSKTLTTIFFENLLPVLQKKLNVKLIWFVYSPEKLTTKISNENEIFIHIHDYKNAVDAIQKLKPDLIYASPDWSFIDYAFASAATRYNIPVFFMIHNRDFIKTKRKTIKSVQTNFLRFFESSIPTDTMNNEKKFMRRGMFFLSKYIFLLKTKIKLRESIFHTLFGIWYYIVTDSNDVRFASNTIQYLESKSLINELTKLGFKKTNLFVTGNPIYDKLYSRSKFSKINIDSIKILFAPSTLYEHGFWTLDQRNYTIKQIVEKIIKHNNFILSVKIHPSSSILLDYETLIHNIDPKIPIFQKGSIEDYLGDFDVIISSESSTAEIYALLQNKRIVICNFFESIDDLLVKYGVAIQCRNPDNIIQCIIDSINLDTYEKSRNNFINNFMYKWDGKCSERISEHLLSQVLNKT